MSNFEKSKEAHLDMMSKRKLHIEHALDSTYREVSKSKRDYLNGRLKQRDAVEVLYDTVLALIENQVKRSL